MPTDAARLVYLLQHCFTRAHKNLEHFSHNLVAGYRLAYESLFNDYGQPHIVAYYCKKKTAELSCFEVETPRRFESLFRSYGEELDCATGLGGFCVTKFSGNDAVINGEAFCGN